MGDVSLSGYSGTLESMLDEDIGSFLSVNASLMPQIEEGETTLLRIYSAGTNEVLKVRMEKGLYIAVQRGMQRTRPSPHPIGACVQGIGQDLNSCDIATLLCEDDEALAGLAMCLDAELKVTEQITSLLESQETTTTLLQNTRDTLEQLTADHIAFVTETKNTITELNQTIVNQGEQLVQSDECCEELKGQVNQLTGQINAVQTTLNTFNDTINNIQSLQENYNPLDDFTCAQLIEKCPELVAGGSGGGGDDDHPEDGTVVGEAFFDCRCPEGTAQAGLSLGSFTIFYTSNGDGTYTWTYVETNPPFSPDPILTGGAPHPASTQVTEPQLNLTAAVARFQEIKNQTECDINPDACMGA